LLKQEQKRDKKRPINRMQKTRLEIQTEEQSGLHLAHPTACREKWKMEEGDKGRRYLLKFQFFPK
jgi:hypothetical protein